MTVGPPSPPFFFLLSFESGILSEDMGTCTSQAPARRGGGSNTIRMISSNISEAIYHIYQAD